MRVDTADGQHRFAVSLAGYGYMGDLMEASEKLRWMGPPRYTTAGAVTLFKGQTYHARISYRPPDTSRSAKSFYLQFTRLEAECLGFQFMLC